MPSPLKPLLRPKAVLFDIDGTLIDSNDAHAQAWKETFDHFNYPVPFDEIRNEIGKGGDKLLPELIGIEEESARGKELSAYRGKIFQEFYLPRLKAFPEVLALLKKIKEQGLRIASATSGNRTDLVALLKQISVLEFFDVLVSSDDAENSKPDPDILEAAMRRLKVSPQELVMVGDTPFDVAAARKAGVRSMAVRCGGRTEDELKGADRIYQDPADLLKHYDDSLLNGASTEQERLRQ